MSNNNIALTGLSNELAATGYDPFTEFYIKYPLFIANERLSPSFKQVDSFQDLAYFLNNIYQESILNQNILNISFTYNEELFNQTYLYLKKLGIIASLDQQNQALLLKYNSSIEDKTDNKDILCFSG
ncbi:MAG: hypothetical protein AABY27_04645, partial [Pseudomonadota bacterium]